MSRKGGPEILASNSSPSIPCPNYMPHHLHFLFPHHSFSSGFLSGSYRSLCLEQEGSKFSPPITSPSTLTTPDISEIVWPLPTSQRAIKCPLSQCCSSPHPSRQAELLPMLRKLFLPPVLMAGTCHPLGLTEEFTVFQLKFISLPNLMLLYSNPICFLQSPHNYLSLF